MSDHIAAALRAETGITSSAAHAEADALGWSDHAMALLGRYAQSPAGAFGSAPFTMEQFRLWAYQHGLEPPAEERAFGAITRKALKLGLIVKVGYAAAASSNNSPKATYRGVL